MQRSGICGLFCKPGRTAVTEALEEQDESAEGRDNARNALPHRMDILIGLVTKEIGPAAIESDMPF